MVPTTETSRVLSRIDLSLNGRTSLGAAARGWRVCHLQETERNGFELIVEERTQPISLGSESESAALNSGAGK